MSTLCTGWRNLDTKTATKNNNPAQIQFLDSYYLHILNPPYLQEDAASWGGIGRPCGAGAPGLVKPNISWNTHTYISHRICVSITRYTSLYLNLDPPVARSSTYLDLFGGEILGAPEYIALGDALTAELMYLNHPSKRYEAHQCIRRQEAEGHLQGLLQCLKVLFFQTCVHHIKKDQRRRGSTLERSGRSSHHA